MSDELLDKLGKIAYTQGIEKRKNIMTTSQLKGMMNFHRKAYRAYKTVGNTANAEQARAKMIELYLKLRASR